MAFQRPPSKVQICLATDRQPYGIGDTIQGEVCLTPRKRLSPELLSISFEGLSLVSSVGPSPDDLYLLRQN